MNAKSLFFMLTVSFCGDSMIATYRVIANLRVNRLDSIKPIAFTVGIQVNFSDYGLIDFANF
jgi:hypothetical protein